MKKTLSVLAALALALASGTAAYAGHGYGKSGCPYAKGGKGKMSCKFFGKAHGALANKDKIDLTEEQYEQIVALKIQVKKDLIRQGADIDILAVDIKSNLYRDDFDAATVNGLVDKKYDIKKAKVKGIVQALATLNGILTKKQHEELKEIRHAQK